MKPSVIFRATKGLFWKIFLAFWLTSFVIMALTTFIVVKSLENRKIDPNEKLLVLDVVRELVWYYEQGVNIQEKMHLRRLVREHARQRKAHLQPFSIMDEQGNKLFRYRMGMVPEGHEPYYFPFVSVNDSLYHVEAYVRSPKRFVLAGLRRLNILQLVLVVIAFAVVSFFVSWSIASPLKKLGAASRSFTGGRELSIDPPLLLRHDEIGNLSRDFKQMSEQVENNIQQRRQLLHDVSHELRAPLARLQTAAGLIQQKNHEDSRHIDRLHIECEKISALIQHILDYSRMDQLEPEPAEVAFPEFVETHVDSVRYEFSQKDITLVSSDNVWHAQIFPELLEAALVNVLRNACKHTDSSITVALNKLSERMTIEVRDFGGGVKEEDLEKLVTPFYRAENNMHSDGYGLGLSIAKRAMEKHNGDIKIANHEQGGLLVTLSFSSL